MDEIRDGGAGAVDDVELDGEFDEEFDGEFDEENVLLLEEAPAGGDALSGGAQELELPVWEPTGEPSVDAALDRLAELDADDVHQHAAVFEAIHQELRATLTDLDVGD